MQRGDIGSGRAQIVASDDLVLPFQTEQARVLGRLVRLGPMVDAILSRHDYPQAVSETLGQALALTAMLGTTLKFSGQLILQTSTDGPLNLIVVNYETGDDGGDGRMRGYAGQDPEKIAALADEGGRIDQRALIGKGHLAMTIDPGEDMDRYQGIVALDGGTLADAALGYFHQSEQLPTFLRLAVARHFVPAADGSAPTWRWRAGGLLIQHLPGEGGFRPSPTADDNEEEPPLAGEVDDDWQRTRLLAATVEDHELLDPTLEPEELLYRLFHEEGVRVFPARRLSEFCRCSRERVHAFLETFGAAELADMREEDGTVAVTCEFCSTRYRFAPGEIS